MHRQTIKIGDAIKEIDFTVKSTFEKPALVNRIFRFPRSVTPSACKEIFNFLQAFH